MTETMRDRFVRWACKNGLFIGRPDDGLYADWNTEMQWRAWQAAEKEYWPPKPDKLPDGYELAGDEPVDVRNVAHDARTMGTDGLVITGADWADLSEPIMRWPVRFIAEPEVDRPRGCVMCQHANLSATSKECGYCIVTGTYPNWTPKLPKPAPRMVPLGPDDIGEWVRDAAGLVAIHINAIGEHGVEFAAAKEHRFVSFMDLRQGGWQHSHDRKTWLPCEKLDGS